jgi:hypothetical protein
MATKSSSSPGAGVAAAAKVLSRASGTQVDVEMLKAIAMFCGVGLVVSLLLATNCLDISARFSEHQLERTTANYIGM